MPNAPVITPDIVEGFIGLAKKAAMVADAQGVEIVALRKQAAVLAQENDRLKGTAGLTEKQASVFADFLDREQLLPEGITAEKAASAIQRNPAGLISTLIRVIAPVPGDGQAVKVANQISGSPALVDHDGWLDACDA